jgi:peptide-methionine (S)-S-oxide reductase
MARPRRAARLVAALLALVGVAGAAPSMAQEGIPIPPPVLAEAGGEGEGMAVAVLAGGCFWGVQGVFQHVEGVLNAVSGYAGGEEETAHYRMVISGATGHASRSRSPTTDQDQLWKLLHIIFSVAHDPTQLNRQGRM